LSDVKKSDYYSSLLLHKVELEAWSGLRLYPSRKTLFAVSLVVWVKVSLFV